MTLTKGQAVEVNVDLGRALGKYWLKGYSFSRYENEQTCLVVHDSGFSAGVEVRYACNDVREVVNDHYAK